MKVSPQGIEFIKAQQQLCLKAALNDAGKWTIGYGHTGSVEAGDIITLVQAELLLNNDLLQCSQILDRALKVPVSQNQFDALCSLLHSVGPGEPAQQAGLIKLKSGQPSTLLMFLNQGCYAAAAEQFGSWIYSGNRVTKELICRRERERNLFLRKK